MQNRETNSLLTIFEKVRTVAGSKTAFYSWIYLGMLVMVMWLQKADRAGPSSAHHRTGLAKVTESSDSGRGSLC